MHSLTLTRQENNIVLHYMHDIKNLEPSQFSSKRWRKSTVKVINIDSVRKRLKIPSHKKI